MVGAVLLVFLIAFGIALVLGTLLSLAGGATAHDLDEAILVPERTEG